ncbi:MAG: EpsI family protein [Isosphaeraceae bacterium]
MSRIHRTSFCIAMLSLCLAAQAALERVSPSDRPALLRSLGTIPLQLGDWVGSDQPVHPDLIERSETTDYISRVYENRNYPGLKLQLWINYSCFGRNLRHTPEVCLPSGGWTKIESSTREFEIPAGRNASTWLTRLGYSRGELVEHVGFWYYVFGEGRLEKYVRRLPITSRSSHGRTTRGSSMTVEVFYMGDLDPDSKALREFAAKLIGAIEPILPTDLAAYHVP